MKRSTPRFVPKHRRECHVEHGLQSSGSGSLGWADRQADDERGAATDRAFDSHASFVFIDDVFAGRQTQSGAAFARFVRAGFGGEVWIEDLGQDVLGDPFA